MNGGKLDRRHEVRQTVFRQFHFIFFALPRVSHRNVNVNAPRAVVERSIRSNSVGRDDFFLSRNPQNPFLPLVPRRGISGPAATIGMPGRHVNNGIDMI